MRTLYNTYPESTGLPKEYHSVPPPDVKCFPEYLRAAGYFTSNNKKTDYQFIAPPTVWDRNSDTASWRDREEGRPFFSVMNFTTTHESQIWKKAKNPMRADPDKVPVPPYYPDSEISRNDIARHYSNISELDDQVGEVLAQLEEDGLMDNTIIFFWGDHGDGLPFYKREIYRRGLHIPLIVRFPDGKAAGTRNDEFISAIDFGPTVLSLAGIETPGQMHGKPFLGKFKQEQGRDHIFAARDRLDSEYDRVRSVMNGQYQYIRNFQPKKPLYMDIDFRKSIPTMRLLLERKEEGRLSEDQSFWFKPTKPSEELYDWVNDPYQLNNLAGEEAHAETLAKLREVMDTWIFETEDLGGIPEKELVEQMWNGADQQPVTAQPLVYSSDEKIKIISLSTGASIGYRKAGSDRWEVYTGEISLPEGDYEAIAMRIGYVPSDVVAFKV
jgi:arylsulfatase A-like enzyme